jgi:hypothetical protein
MYQPGFAVYITLGFTKSQNHNSHRYQNLKTENEPMTNFLNRSRNATCLASVSALLLLLTSCGGGGDAGSSGSSTGGPPSSSGALSATVTYSVSGTTSSASLTYSNSQGGTVQQTVSLPWSVKYDMKARDFLYISAQNQNDTGSVTTEIRINGYIYRTTTSNGAYVIATASGSCC